MKTTLLKLVNSSGSLGTLVETKLPVKLALRVARLTKRVSEELELFNKQRLSLLEKYGEKEGEQYRIPPESQAGFSKEYEELVNDEVELPDTEITIEDIPDTIRPVDLLALDWLIKDGGA